ncbi:MAG TPA: tetratricopeptide repeat protein, partial [Nannocystaceae bacterium]|nr:tetratricopeptide repeat protein [Nannocystaceae bacterium]
LEILRPTLGDAHDHVAYAKMAYGSLLRRRGDLERARDLLRQAAAVFAASPDNPQSPIADAELGGTLVDLGQTSAAIPLLEAALARPAHGAFGPLSRATARLALARALWIRTSERERARELVAAAQHELANAELHGRQDEARRELSIELDAWRAEH